MCLLRHYHDDSFRKNVMGEVDQPGARSPLASAAAAVGRPENLVGYRGSDGTMAINVPFSFCLVIVGALTTIIGISASVDSLTTVIGIIAFTTIVGIIAFVIKS